MKQHVIAPAHEDQVLLSSPKLREALAPLVGEVRKVEAIKRGDRSSVYNLETSRGDHILRIPHMPHVAAALEREARIAAGLRPFVSIPLALPDVRIVRVDKLSLAIHPTISGRELTGEGYEALGPDGKRALVSDLATFMRDTHLVPREIAQAWCGSDAAAPAGEGESAVFEIPWREINARLAPRLDPHLEAVMADTRRRHRAVMASPRRLVFGHMDLHGGNMAFDYGRGRLVGLIDLGCASTADIHMDFFRLALVSEDLLARVMARYQAISQIGGDLDPERIETLYRSFVFYLMAEHALRPEPNLVGHLGEMLRRHLRADAVDARDGEARAGIG